MRGWSWQETQEEAFMGNEEEGDGAAHQVEDSGEDESCAGFLCGTTGEDPEETAGEKDTPCGCSRGDCGHK